MEAPTKITFSFTKDEGYRLLSVNGVWGGPTPRGDILVNFFHESQAIPETVTHEVASAGQLGDELERAPKPVFQRTVLVGMMLTAEQAESIGRWLQEKARKVRERTGDKGGGEHERDTPTTH